MYTDQPRAMHSKSKSGFGGQTDPTNKSGKLWVSQICLFMDSKHDHRRPF